MYLDRMRKQQPSIRDGGGRARARTKISKLASVRRLRCWRAVLVCGNDVSFVWCVGRSVVSWVCGSMCVGSASVCLCSDLGQHGLEAVLAPLLHLLLQSTPLLALATGKGCPNRTRLVVALSMPLLLVLALWAPEATGQGGQKRTD